MRIDALVVRLLVALVMDAGRLVTKAELIARVWGGRAVSDNVITVAMVRLRKTLGHRTGEREFIVNLHGRGYRFVRPVTSRSTSPLPAATAVLLPSAPPEGPPFVGREGAMGRLRAALAEAQAGRGGACLLMGEAGIGKTRAVEWLSGEAAATGFPVAWGYCQEAGDTPPLWPIAQLVRELLALRVLDEPALAPEVRWLLDEMGGRASAKNAPKPAAKHLIFEAILAVFARAAPCVLILDDLHRADAASLELVRYFLDRIARTRVLLVATMRSAPTQGVAAPDDYAHVVSHRNCARLVLERLSAASVETYVSALLPNADRGVAHAVWIKSEGNPFFMVELARQLVDAARTDAASLTVPDAALELVRPRLLALDVAARGVLSQAAVIGRSFELRVLQALTGYDASTLMGYLDDAIASQVVVAAADSITAFGFGHELIRQLLYDDLPAGTRRQLHRRVAEYFEKQLEGAGGIPTGVLAYHFYTALPDAPIDAAVRYCGAASQEAANLFAYADALRYLRYAREAQLLHSAPDPKVRMLILLGLAVYGRICAAPDFERLTDELIRLAREQRDGPFMVHGGLLRDLHTGFPALPRARDTLEEGLTLLPEDSPVRPAALARLATSAPLAFDDEKSGSQIAGALALGERSGELVSIFTTRYVALYLRGGPRHRAEADAAEAALERLCVEHPLTITVTPVLLELHRAIRAFQAGLPARTLEALARADARCQQIGNRELTWHVARFRALLRIYVGQEKKRAAATLRALHRQAQAESIVAIELLSVHDAVVVLGDAVEPAVLHRVVVPAPEDAPSVWSIKLRVLLAAGLVDEARAVLHAVPSAALAKLPCDRDYLGTLGVLARASLALGERAYAAATYELLLPYPDHLAVHLAFHCEGPVALLLGELAQALGRADAAECHFEAALTLAERLALPAGFIARARTALGIDEKRA